MSKRPPSRPRAAPWLAAALLLLWAGAAGAEPPAPILTGPGRGTLTAQDLASLHAMADAITGGTTEQIWMLDCQAHWDGPEAGRPFRVEVYLTPRVSTERLVRCRKLLCLYPSKENTWNRDSPVVDGWSCADRDPSACAFVAPAGEPFTPGGPYGTAFFAPEAWSDADVVALVDAEHAADPRQEVHGLRWVSADHACVWGMGRRGAPNLDIDFERTAGVWVETRRTRWVYY